MSHSELDDLPQHSHFENRFERAFLDRTLCVFCTRVVCTRAHMCTRAHTRVWTSAVRLRAVLRTHVCWPRCRFTYSILDRMCKDSLCVRVGLRLCTRVRVRSRVRTRVCVCVRCVCVARLKPFDFFV